MAPVYGDCKDGGGVVRKRLALDPDGEIEDVSPTGSSQVEFNLDRPP
jgi:hypothetical protein